MNEEQARKILGNTIREDGSLYGGYECILWSPGDTDVTLDGEFSADELAAMAWWMRNKAAPPR